MYPLIRGTRTIVNISGSFFSHFTFHQPFTFQLPSIYLSQNLRVPFCTLHKPYTINYNDDMFIDGREIPLSEYDVPYEEIFAAQQQLGWRYYSQFNADIPEGIPISGYKIFYRASDGHLYSPFSPGASYIEDGIARGTTDDRIIPQDPGQVLHEGTGKGYYYWVDRAMSETYMSSLIAQTNKRDLTHSQFVPGQLEIHRVEGTSLRGNVGDEGNRIQDITVDPEPLVVVKYSEFTRRPR